MKFEGCSGGRSIEGLTFHDFRHTAITNMRKADGPDRVIMIISGHKTLAMLDRYGRIDGEDLLLAMAETATYAATRSNEDETEGAVSG